MWKGRLLDVAGEATFAIQDDVMAGTVFAGDRVFEILYAGDGEHEVREIEPSEFPTDDPHRRPRAAMEPDPQAEAMDAAVAAEMAGDAGVQIDVMVIWTPAARAAAGGTSAIQSLVNLAVANANTAYANSAVTQRLRLVYSGEMSYTEVGPVDRPRAGWPLAGRRLSRHRPRASQHLRRRRRDAARRGLRQCGDVWHWLPDDIGVDRFCQQRLQSSSIGLCAAGNLSYAHELGHNMGLQHDPANASGSPAYSYAYGYQQPAGAFRTVMAYACPTGGCPRRDALRQPVGDLQRHADRHGLAEHRAGAQQHRADRGELPSGRHGLVHVFIGGTSASVGSGTATSSVAVSTGSGCAWTATSNASWLTITSGASGTGPGTVAYTVAANTTPTGRSGVITVGDKTLVVSQAAAACTSP